VATGNLVLAQATGLVVGFSQSGDQVGASLAADDFNSD
jgi:hypothetical protein